MKAIKAANDTLDKITKTIVKKVSNLTFYFNNVKYKTRVWTIFYYNWRPPLRQGRDEDVIEAGCEEAEVSRMQLQLCNMALACLWCSQCPLSSTGWATVCSSLSSAAMLSADCTNHCSQPQTLASRDRRLPTNCSTIVFYNKSLAVSDSVWRMELVSTNVSDAVISCLDTAWFQTSKKVQNILDNVLTLFWKNILL